MGQSQSRIDPNRKPQPGDHIYSPRSGGLYDHHGIYVGDDMVIHLQAPFKQIGSSSSFQQIGSSSSFQQIGSSSSFQQIESSSSCEKCGYNKRDHCNGGIIKTCLDCFLDHHPLLFYKYGVSNAEFRRSRRGTCSVYDSKPAHEVIKIATDFLEKKRDFGPYNIIKNNCENFAVYCKTGMALSMQVLGHVETVNELADTVPSVAGIVGVSASLAFAGAYGLAKVADRRRENRALGHFQN